MKLYNFYLVFICAISILLCSCNNDDEIIADSQKDVEFVENANILKFRDLGIFDEYVSNAKSVEGFESLYDNFLKAMDEAESYYDREGGYEEFKIKYVGLYFPEEGDDYSAYLPVSDENIAKLLNDAGCVMIGESIVDMKDINTYAQLEELGKTPPVEDGLRASKGFISPTYTFGGDRRIWIYSYKSAKRSGTYYNQVEVCFRKKGFLGQWYNYSSKTTLVVGSFTKTISSVSSHDYYVPCIMLGSSGNLPIPMANSGVVTWLGHAISIQIN